MNCIHTQAIATFLFVARNQLFRDGNKRTGRLLMNGLLLSGGHDVITVPARKRLEFNEKMLRFYDTADSSEMTEFLVACSIDRELTIQPGECRPCRLDAEHCAVRGHPDASSS